MDHMIDSGCADASLRDLFTVQPDAAGAVAYLSLANASVN